MRRRDFLLFRREQARLTAVLDCHQLQMAYLERQVTAPEAAETWSDIDPPGGGEPPARFSKRHPGAMLDALEGDLRQARSLTVVGRDWLLTEELRRSVERLVEQFRAGGGLVEYASAWPRPWRPA